MTLNDRYTATAQSHALDIHTFSLLHYHVMTVLLKYSTA